MIFDKIKPIVVLLSGAILTLSTFSQTLPLVDNSPFKIERGSSFQASGESSTKRITADKAHPKQIISDIEEAMSIIDRNGIRGNSKDSTADTVEGMLHTLDPHSHFYTKDEWTELLDDYNNEFVGVGVSLISRVRDNLIGTYVVSTVPGSPAASANLHYSDEILRVGNIDTKGKGSIEVSSLIRGGNGTTVNLTIKDSGSRVRTVRLVRTTLPQPTVSAVFMVNDKVGYIGLTHGFSFTSASEVRSAAAKLTALGMTSLVLDIRGNPGGILEQSVKVAEQFLPAGATIVSQRGRVLSDTRIWRSGNNAKLTIPLILLVDGESASASEVLAGAMQDNDRALIIGQRTFGKGLVQNVIDLPEKAGLTLTAAQYYTPSGRSIQRDYSDGSLYNYYNHKNQIAIIDKPQYVAKTITERRVYGGNGIEPDIAVETQKLSVHILDAIAFYAAGNANRQSGFNDEKLFEDFTLSAKFLAGSSKSDQDLIIRSLRIELALAKSGALAGNHERIMTDPAINTAISQMDRSGELYAKALQVRSSTISQNKKAR